MSIIHNYQATSNFWDKNATKFKVRFEKEKFSKGEEMYSRRVKEHLQGQKWHCTTDRKQLDWQGASVLVK